MSDAALPDPARADPPLPDPARADRAKPDTVDRFLDMLDLEDIGPDQYRAANPASGFGVRVFGGQVAAQSLRAAASTVAVEHAPHSLHAYFLRPGAPGVPIDFAVERTRDGRSFTTRRVLASQGDEVIFEASISFHTLEPGADYQVPRSTDVPEPSDSIDVVGEVPEFIRDRMPFDMIDLGATAPDERGWYQSTRRSWVRVKRRLPDDPIIHRCALAFVSDMGAVFGALAPMTMASRNQLMAASLDHAMWFHRPMRADEWILYDLQAVSNAGARGLARGTMHTAAGVLGASVAQEALLRVIDVARHA
jgi:acyl-CoA thioesterase II